MNFRLLIPFLLLISLPQSAVSQLIQGFVADEHQHPIPFATLYWQKAKTGTQANRNGAYSLELSAQSNDTIEIRAAGFSTLRLSAEQFNKQSHQILLKETTIDLNPLVVSATREPIRLREAPVSIQVISPQLLQSTQSNSMADGLRFSSGLRVENNCQNCGFTGVRMNGLPAAYSQILINSRPVYSALNSIYGLEQIPPAMIGSIEVIRGGGSVLYGGNAIAGTVNILTKSPTENTWSASLTQGMTNLSKADLNGNFHISRVDSALTKGLIGFVSSRNRLAWDANGDGFSEIPELKNIVAGIQSFWAPNETSRWTFSARFIEDKRRGGSEIDQLPQESRVAEMANHRVFGAEVSYEFSHPTNRWKGTIYSSIQHTARKSFYGTSEHPQPEKQYGNASDWSLANGIQWLRQLPALRSQIMLGSEWINNTVLDQYPGYQRTIDQTVRTLGSFFQWQWKIHRTLSINSGIRFDQVWIRGKSRFEMAQFNNNHQLVVPNARVTLKWNPVNPLTLRLNGSSGYRAPQAFDEDLHIEIVGGNARFVKLSPDLKPETSKSFSSTAEWVISKGKHIGKLSVDAFHTELLNPFINADLQQIDAGVSIIEKRNGSKARVWGMNLELQYDLGKTMNLKTGFTNQRTQYAQTEILWQSSDTVVSTSRFLRTPNQYAYLNLDVFVHRTIQAGVSVVYTGRMEVSHVLNAQTGYQAIKTTPNFWEIGLRITKTWKGNKYLRFETDAGIQNLFNQYQKDFDVGRLRDAGYVYGPLRPRTLQLTLRVQRK